MVQLRADLSLCVTPSTVRKVISLSLRHLNGLYHNYRFCSRGWLAQWKTVRFVIIFAIGCAFQSQARIFSSAINNLHYMLDFESSKYVDPRNLEVGNTVVDHPTSERKGT